MTSREIIDFVFAELEKQNRTDYNIRKNTGVTETTLRKIRGGGGTTLDTIIKLADYCALEIKITPKNKQYKGE